MIDGTRCIINGAVAFVGIVRINDICNVICPIALRGFGDGRWIWFVIV